MTLGPFSLLFPSFLMTDQIFWASKNSDSITLFLYFSTLNYQSSFLSFFLKKISSFFPSFCIIYLFFLIFKFSPLLFTSLIFFSLFPFLPILISFTSFLPLLLFLFSSHLSLCLPTFPYCPYVTPLKTCHKVMDGLKLTNNCDWKFLLSGQVTLDPKSFHLFINIISFYYF